MRNNAIETGRPAAMRILGDMPIKRKLLVVIMLTTTAGMLLSGAGIVAADSYLFRGYLQRDLSALTRIIADNTTAALDFDDPKSAGETLAALKARPHLVAACIYEKHGAMLASYFRTGAVAECPAATPEFEVRSTPGGLRVSQPVVLKGQRIGTLVILYDLGEIAERSRLYSAVVLGVVVASGLIAFALSSRLRAIIATPISQLAQATASVSATEDYSIRARKYYSDELGVLVEAFNQMLAGIQSRDSDLKKALLDREAALKEAQNAREFLQTTLASIGDAVISTDVEGRIVFANPVAQALVRWSASELAGRHLDEVLRIVNEFNRESVESPVTKVLLSGGVVGMANHTILIARDGTEVPIDDSAAPIRDERGTILGAVLVFRDVRARRSAEEARRLLASIVESSSDAIAGIDLNGRFTSWNQGAERIFGYSAAEMIGSHTSKIAVGESADEMPEILERIKKGESVEQYQAPRRTKSGKVIDVANTVSPLYDALRRIVGASKIARDITEQAFAAARLAQLNAELQRSNEHLARSNEDLERFAFVASHDLQEPLRMIAIYSQLLIRAWPGGPSADADAFAANIVGATKRMRELLADLLAYSEIGARPEEPASAVDLNAVLEKVLENLKASAADSGAVITAGPLPTLNAYEGHFIPLFQNLIENAIKYRSARPPRIHIAMEETAGLMRFSVADNGIGIEPQYQEKIFAPFKRLHGKNIPGTGIGLAICQRVVERYGGLIWVESQAGQGATFIFTLPGNLRVKKEG